MQELRLVGVQEDGNHLLLSSEQGVSFRLPVDDALRRAASMSAASMSAASMSAASESAPPEPPPAPARPVAPRARANRAPIPLTPRDIQARIRAGASAEQVADDSGLELAHVQRYEGPVRAEREYVAYLAQRVEVASPLPSHDGYRSAFGDSPALLGDMVAHRAQEFGVDQSDLEWDSWRRADGAWHVEVAFELPDDSRVDLGEQPPAQWTYNPTRKTVTNANRWAQVLSELEPLDGPLPSRRLSAVVDRVFDFEADTADAGTGDAEGSTDTDQDGLLDVLRSRRGQRLGADEDGDDALAELLTRGSIPAAHPRTGDVPAAEDQGESGSAGPGVTVPGLSLAPPTDGPDDDATGQESAFNADGTPRLYEGVSVETREISFFAHPARGPRPQSQSSTGTGTGTGTDRGAGDRSKDPSAQETGERTAREGRRNTGRTEGRNTEAGEERKEPAEPTSDRRPKPKRSSVPSWDDIVFGRKSD
ncbi:DUF3071 domain-containing protein [Arthrobacter echini]|uniref:DUF3071 domain-containing protein n=1 Tax=Arthrobacter echini TaxID=1529066 RepID=A0A4S5E7H1_9MICC|nr:septation protein SepH [Arthrobacter echini]THJ67504.1 DUF3071 domain-containing protein [Arthrobacter echini]